MGIGRVRRNEMSDEITILPPYVEPQHQVIIDEALKTLKEYTEHLEAKLRTLQAG
jgi:stress response protein YsnF